MSEKSSEDKDLRIADLTGRLAAAEERAADKALQVTALEKKIADRGKMILELEVRLRELNRRFEVQSNISASSMKQVRDVQDALRQRALRMAEQASLISRLDMQLCHSRAQLAAIQKKRSVRFSLWARQILAKLGFRGRSRASASDLTGCLAHDSGVSVRPKTGEASNALT